MKYVYTRLNLYIQYMDTVIEYAQNADIEKNSKITFFQFSTKLLPLRWWNLSGALFILVWSHVEWENPKILARR